MVKTQQEIYAEKYRAGTLTGAERSTLLNVGKTLGIEETQKRLQTPQAETPVMQQPQPQVGASPVPKVYQENTVFANDQKAQPTIQPAQPTTQQPAQPIKTDTPQDITYSEDTVPFSMDKVIGRAEKFQGADKKMYQTVRNSDNTLTTIDVQTGQAVTGKYTDDKRDQIKQSFLQQNEQQVPDVDTMFQSIRAGQNVPTSMQNTVQYQRASQRLANVSQYENLSANDVAYSMQQGKILPGSQTYMDLKAINPQLVAQAEQLNSINSAFSKEKKTNEDYLTTITEKILASYTGDVQSLQSILSENPQVVKLNEDMQSKALEVAEMKDAIEYNLDDIEDRLSGTGATRGEALALNSMQMKELTRAYNLKLNEYNTLAGTLERITENIKYEQEEKQQNEAQQLKALEFAYGIQTREQDYQRTLDAEKRAEEAQTKTLEQNYAYQYGDLNSENPTLQNIAIERAVAGMYENYPIPGLESQATKVQKVKNLIAQGMTGTEAIAQVESEIRNSQRYKDYIASEQRALQPQAPELIKMGENALYDPVNQRWITPPTTKSAEVMSLQEGDIGGQCGTFARQYVGFTQGLDSVVGKTASDRRKTMTETEPVVGGLAFFEGGSYNKEYGHIEVVKSINADGTITLVGSNLNNDQKVTERTVPISEVKGFYNDTPLATGGGSISQLGQFLKDNQSRGPGYSAEDVKAFDDKIDRFIANGDEQGMALAFRKNIMDDKDFRQEFDNTQKFNKALDDVSVMINAYEKAGKSTNALKSMAEKVARKVGITTDEALAQLQTQMGFTMANYIRSISGTAASDTEVQRLMGNMAQIGNVKELNSALVEQARNNSTSALKSMIDTRMYGMPEDLKPKVFGDVYGTTAPTQTTTPATVNYGGKTYNFKPKQ